MSETSKDQAVETLRAIALILLVAFHSAETYYPKIYEYILYSFNYIRMPLFTMISGFVYALRPVNKGSEKVFFQGKVRRIIVPLIVVETIYFTMQMITKGEWNKLSEIWRVYFFSYEYFWFLQAVFLIFLTFLVLDRFKLIEKVEQWFSWLIMSVFISLFVPKTFFLSLEGYFYLLPYFSLGYGINRYGKQLFVPLIVNAALFAFVISFTIHQLIWFQLIDIPHVPISVLALCVGLNGVFLLFRFRFNIPILAKLGSYSYTAYLYHGIGISIVFKIMGILGLHEQYLIEFILKIIVGIGLGLLMDHFCSYYSLTRRLFLGKR
jgi:glucans biosynthesis protein C